MVFSGGHYPGTFDCVNSGARFPQTIQHDLDLLDLIGRLSKPGCKIRIVQAISDSVSGLVSANKLASQMKLAGLVGVQAPRVVSLEANQMVELCEHLKIASGSDVKVVEIDCLSPNFAAGSSTPLSFAQKIKKAPKKPEKKVWSLADTDDEDVDLINEDDLLDDEDLTRPDQESLRVCGTTGKRKACKDCSCGLAEELSGGNAAPKKSFNSSCGSVCSLLKKKKSKFASVVFFCISVLPW